MKDPWIVDVKGEAMGSFEISVIRTSFTHGFMSYGWFGENKRYISGSGGPCHDKVSRSVFKALLKVAQDEAERLNSLYQ